MKLTSIKVGCWYETTMGVGKCTASGGTFPPSVMIDIVAPLPRGRINFKPRDVTREVPDPTPKERT